MLRIIQFGALLWIAVIVFTVCVVTIKLAATGELDWPMLAAGLLMIPAGVVTWREARKRRSADTRTLHR
jgi:hypothetical protein